MAVIDTASLREKVERAGQEHLLEGWGELDEAGRARLARELAELDFELVAELQRALRAERERPDAPAPRFEPPEVFPLRRTAAEEARARSARERGAEEFAAGRVGYLVVAGGQASRLGYDAPKGMFPIGPVSARSLFEFHALRLRAAAERYGTRAPWYVMTSPANDVETQAFFRAHDYFGLDAGDVFFFAQATNPALDEQGRILMLAPDRLFRAPNGHGGVLLALESSGGLADARARALEHLSYFQVDNPLARPGDELFLGLHAEAGAGMSSKVVRKRDAEEKVGVLGRIDGTLGCIEYLDLPRELRDARRPDGELRFADGNIAVHAIDVGFVEQLTRGGLFLPWHVAHKRMQIWRQGATAETWGYKFETFVFDALGRSPASVTLEVERAREFSPVKNAEGADSPRTARRDLCALHAGWVRARGLELPGPDADGVHPVEVSPLVAEDEAQFLAREHVEPRVTDAGHLYD